MWGCVWNVWWHYSYVYSECCIYLVFVEAVSRCRNLVKPCVGLQCSSLTFEIVSCLHLCRLWFVQCLSEWTILLWCSASSGGSRNKSEMGGRGMADLCLHACVKSIVLIEHKSPSPFSNMLGKAPKCIGPLMPTAMLVYDWRTLLCMHCAWLVPCACSPLQLGVLCDACHPADQEHAHRCHRAVVLQSSMHNTLCFLFHVLRRIGWCSELGSPWVAWRLWTGGPHQGGDFVAGWEMVV